MYQKSRSEFGEYFKCHVNDLALGHVKALERLQENCGVKIYNPGMGKDYSMLEVLHAFETACGKSLPYKFAERRAGDLVVSYSDPSLAKAEFGWEANVILLPCVRMRGDGRE